MELKVSDDLRPRALRFIELLSKEIELKGYKIETLPFGTFVIIKGNAIKISCREKMKRVAGPQFKWFPKPFKPSGLLVFTIEGKPLSRITESRIPIDQRIPEIIMALEDHIRELGKMRFY